MTYLVSVTSESPLRSAPSRLVPCVELFAASVLVSRTEGLRDIDEERVLPLLSLSFDYDGTRVRSGDTQERLFRSGASGILPVLRDVRAETAARQILERFGAVELGCLEDLAPPTTATRTTSSGRTPAPTPSAPSRPRRSRSSARRAGRSASPTTTRSR